jgi:hypothetical protein
MPEKQQNRPKLTPYRAWLARKASIAARHAGQVPSRFRTLFPAPSGESLLERSQAALWPWDRSQYPGRQRLRAWLLGVSVETAREYRKKLPRSRALILATRLEDIARRLLTMACECRAYAGQPCDAPSATVSGSVPPPDVEP